MTSIKILVAGLGNMGLSHALTYHKHPGFEISGLVNRSSPELPQELSGLSVSDTFHAALSAVCCGAGTIYNQSESPAG